MSKWVCLAIAAAAATALPAVSAQWPQWKDGSNGLVMWENECDFFGSDLYLVNQPGELCGEVCAADSLCTHWTFVTGQGCYLKHGGYGAAVYKAKLACGYVVGRYYPFANPPPFPLTPKPTTPAPATPRPTTAPTPAPTPAPVTNGLSSEESLAMLASINALRASIGVPTVTVDARVERAASKHSQDQATRCSVSKTSGDGRVLGDRLAAEGVKATIAVENVAGDNLNTVTDVMNAWLYSLADSTNLFNGDVKQVGFAKATNTNCAGSKTYWTLDLVAA